MDNVIFVPRKFLSTLSLRRATETIIILMEEFDNFYPRSPCGERHARPTASNATTKFLSTLSLRRATHGTNSGTNSSIFLSTLSLRRATNNVLPAYAACGDFYPRSPCGERLPRLRRRRRRGCYFYPRSPCGERPVAAERRRRHKAISIHALLAESDLWQYPGHDPQPDISIHALLAESDTITFNPPVKTTISIHALLAESDAWAWCWPTITAKFLSTLSLRRATRTRREAAAMKNISIHALLAESDHGQIFGKNRIVISIHALLAESDPHASDTEDIKHKFLSTLSLRRATQHRPVF